MSHREEASGRPRTRWGNYVSRLAWERLGVPPEELEEVSGLSKLNSATLLAWLKGRGALVSAKHKKEELMLKAEHFREHQVVINFMFHRECCYRRHTAASEVTVAGGCSVTRSTLKNLNHQLLSSEKQLEKI
ncbi:hypothetical protein L3Q82_004763 [Scortum barcoo]|uniref:Uncharacterized protein n=1 Tax=Scortum barcoo TaxID=214431 RepID=A0ACB8VH20_9TELE|nr:hypothetical protein L3Q82_004763 [Scortum barcoo]